jgi:Holliday junction DNA helicase RuvB
VNDLPQASTAANPSIIDRFIGQAGVVGQVRVALEASWHTGAALPHMLMCGPPGLGKTELARVLAAEMGVELKESLGQALSQRGYLAGFLMSAREKDVLFIDEAHELRPASQTLLYRAMAERKLLLSDKAFGPTPTTICLPPFTLLAATTDEFRLAKPLRERFALSLRFDFYTPGELELLLCQRTRGSGLAVADGVAAAIAARSKGTPRQALRLLENCRRVAASLGRTEVTAEHLVRACALEGLDKLGLDAGERRYLQCIHDAGAGAAIPPHVLAAKVGLPPRTLAEVTEPYLLRAGLIERTKSGRVLTATGRRHLERTSTSAGGGGG